MLAILPFHNIDKMQVVQESKAAFNETPLPSKKCVYMITKLLYLLGQGENMSKTAATDLYFGSTKLFISEDVRNNVARLTWYQLKLRRMLYLLLKELAPFADNIFVAVNSLLKDMSQGKNDEFKANAIRALRKIITEV